MFATKVRLEFNTQYLLHQLKKDSLFAYIKKDLQHKVYNRYVNRIYIKYCPYLKTREHLVIAFPLLDTIYLSTTHTDHYK